MQVRQLKFQHHKNAPLFFKDITFNLEQGKIHALHGKNGTGKTVLLNILSRKLPQEAILQGEIIGGEKSFLVNQRFDQMIADQFSFEENLKFACMNRFPGLFSGLRQPNAYADFLEKFHIDVSLPAYKLSGGQRQILALLMMLQRPTTLLLLDEPTATLDEQNAIMVFEFLKTLSQRDMTLLVVCHDRELVNRYTTGQHLHLEIDSSGTRHMINRIVTPQDR
jgi:ABC-type multidrug transport system ATPase subunit